MSKHVKLVKDDSLKAEKPLPAGASATIATDGIDLGGNSLPVEVVLEVPELSATILPNTKTATVSIEAATDSAFTAPSVIRSQVLAGADGNGAAALALRGAVPPGFRFVRGKVAFGEGTTTAATLTATLFVLA